MSFNALNQYSANHKVWDHVGNIIPDVEHSEGERPSFEFKPAEWLPVQFYDKHYEVWHSVMPGKLVALDPDGRVMPAQYGLTSASVVYTSDDVAAGTIDIATGLAVTAAKTVTLSNLSGSRHASWTRANAGTSSYTSGFMGRFGVNFNDSSKKYPVGVAPYAYNQWAGGDGFNPANLRQHNHILQHQVAVLCDYVLRLPLVPAQAASESISASFSGGNLVIGTSGTHNRSATQANSTGRYNASTGSLPVLGSYPVIALALDNYPVAKNTARTTISLASDNTADDVSGVLLYEKTALSAVASAGDYFVDYDMGVVFIYSQDGATIPASVSGAAGTVSITYCHYASAASTVSKFACVVGASVDPGDFLICDSNSNLTPATTEDFKDIVGQVIGIEDHPKDALDKVRTAYSPAIGTDASGSMANAAAGSASANVGQMDQMPGTATGGYPDNIHYAGAASKIVLVNLVSR